MTNRVALVAIGETKYDEHWDYSLRDLASMAAQKLYMSIFDRFDYRNIESIFVGNAASAAFTGQLHLNAFVADAIGLTNKPSLRIEAADASGAAAVRAAYFAIKSGMFNTALVLGIEKMTELTVSTQINTVQSSVLDREWEEDAGLSLAAAYAIMARKHFETYGTTREHLAAVSAKNHEHAVLNPNAQFRRAFSIEQVLKATMVAEPLSLLDCSPTSDGASAILLANEDLARKITDDPIWISASAQGSDTISLMARDSLTTLKSVRSAAEDAYKQAKIADPKKEIKLIEAHDSFTITELLALEGLKIYEPGQAGPATLAGETHREGSGIPVNVSGGLKAKGHPLGATGVGQLVELALQMWGNAGERQVDDVDRALAVSIGGTGATSFIHNLSR